MHSPVATQRVGRKPLLLTSIASMALCLFVVGFGLNNDHALLTGIFIVLVVASFALGLGAIPFLLVPEIMPTHAIPASQVIALSCSWSTNFFIAIGFLPLRNLMSSPIRGSDRREGEGNVFAVFVGVLVLAWLGIWRYLYRMPTETSLK
jgi:MFS transporter, SP family, solute carrier family 2 (facilitated glucose transporter), member 3